MSEASLKPGWTKVKFGEVVRLCKDRSSDPEADGIERYVGLEHLEPEDLRIRSWGLVADGTTFTSRFKPGQVLFGKRRAYQRKVAIADFEGICSGDIYVFESADPKHLLPDLLPFICQTDRFFEYAIGTSAGSLSPRTSWKQLKDFEIFLPPLDQQFKLARLLNASRLNFEQSEFALGLLKTLRSSTLDHLCEKSGGDEIMLSGACKMQNGRSFPSKYYQEKGVPLLRPGNLGINGYLDWNPDKTVYLDVEFESEALDYLIKKGDVVINLTAQSLEDGFMGRVCLAKGGDKSLLNQRIGRFLFTHNKVLPEFIFRVLQSSNFQQHAISMCEGTKVKHIFWHHLARFKFKLPSLKRQEEIAKQLRQLDESVTALSKRKDKHRQLHFQLVNEITDGACTAKILTRNR